MKYLDVFAEEKIVQSHSFKWLSCNALLSRLGFIIAAQLIANSGFSQAILYDDFTSHAVSSDAGVSVTAAGPKPVGNSYAGAGTAYSANFLVSNSIEEGASEELSRVNDNIFAQAPVGTAAPLASTTQWVLSAANESLTANGSITISFDFFMKASTGSAALSLITYNQLVNSSNYSQGRGLSINLHKNGTVSYYSGTGSSPSGTFTGVFKTDKRQTLTITIDYASHTFEARIGDSEGTGTAVTGGGSFNPLISKLKSVWLNNSASAAVGFYYDNLRVIKHSSPLNLSGTGANAYTIVLPNNASASEVNAAAKFQQYTAEISGVTIPIKTEAQDVSNGPRQILIGYGTRVSALLPEQNFSDLGDEGFVVRTVGEKLILAGADGRGTLYAVYEFLANGLKDGAGNDLKCRWWTPTEKSIPSSPVLSTTHKDVQDTPYFWTRDISAFGLVDDTYSAGVQNEEFATIMRVNGKSQPQGAAWGGQRASWGRAHTHFLFVPPVTNNFGTGQFSAHRDWYTDEKNNGLPCTPSTVLNPSDGTSQLNLSAAGTGLVDHTIARALYFISGDPSISFISISQMDNKVICKCTPCVSLRTQYGGSQSAVDLTFINKVAAGIKLSYPDVMVETLAYKDSVKPPINGPGVPLLRASDNVAVRLAPVGMDLGHALSSNYNGINPPGQPSTWIQEDVQSNLPAWSQISDNLAIWYYAANSHYTMLPFPNLKNWANDFQFLYENNVTSVFVQGDIQTNGVGDFTQLRSWLLAKLLWDPYSNQDSLLNEFLHGYYGSAAPHLKDYLNLVRNSYEATNRKLGVSENTLPYMDHSTMAQGKTYFDQAEASVSGNPTLLSRVKRERVSFDLMWIYQHPMLQQCVAKAGTSYAGPADPVAFLDNVKATAESNGVKMFQENHTSGRGGFVANEYPRLKRKLLASAPLPATIQALVPAGTEDINLIVLYPDDLTENNRNQGSVVADLSASTGVSLRVADAKEDWYSQFEMLKYGSGFLGAGQWRMFIEARATASNMTSGQAFEVVVYDVQTVMAGGTTGYMFYREIPLNLLNSSGFTLLPVGRVSASPTQSNVIPATSYLLFDSPNNWQTANPTTFYIDRIFFVRM